MAQARFGREESIGLFVAVGLHAGLLALLVLRPEGEPVPPPPRMEVTLTDKVGPQETAPNTSEPAAADIAPKLGAAPPPPPAPPVPQPVPPKPIPSPPPVPKPVPRPAPRPTPKPTPKPQPSPKPSPTPSAPAKARPTPAKPAPAQRDTPQKPARTTGGSRIGADFLKGLTSANTTGKAKTAPALMVGKAEQASLLNAIFRQLRPNWHAPQGVDADKLETCLIWDLKSDGSLDGPPRLARPQNGVTDSNRPQATRHYEQAIRAVELAEPFQLPPEYYTTWKHVGPICFDRKMSQ